MPFLTSYQEISDANIKLKELLNALENDYSSVKTINAKELIHREIIRIMQVIEENNSSLLKLEKKKVDSD